MVLPDGWGPDADWSTISHLITICDLFRNTTNSGSRPVTSTSATMTFLHMSRPAVNRAAIKSASKYIAQLFRDAEDHAGAGLL
jgi:hypothetical protein